jgi:hypothetical protein
VFFKRHAFWKPFMNGREAMPTDAREYQFEIDSAMGLVLALADKARRMAPDGTLHPEVEIWLDDVPADFALEAAEDMDLFFPAETPEEDDPGGQERWLSALETLALAARVAAALPASCSWAAGLTSTLEKAIASREECLARGNGWWRFGRSADEGRKRYGETLSPWRLIRDGSSIGEIAAGSSDDAVGIAISSWMCEDLSLRDNDAVRDLVVGDTRWKDAYRAEIARRCDETGVVAVPGALRLSPVFVVPLSHLGEGNRLEARVTDDGLSVTWPGRTRLLLTWNDAGRIEQRIGDEITGDLQLRFTRIDGDLFVTSFAATSALAEIESDPDFPEDRAIEVARAAVGLLDDDNGWRGRLARIANDFNKGKTVDADGVLLVERAIEARASLDALVYRYLNVDLAGLVSELDQRFAEAADAVLVVPEERYYDILEFAMPAPGIWWAAYIDLDREIPEEVLAEALAMSPPAPFAIEKIRQLVRAEWEKLSAPHLLREIGPAYGAVGAVSGRMQAAAAQPSSRRPAPWRYMSENRDWDAVVRSLPESGEVRVRVTRGEGCEDAIPSGTRVWFRGDIKDLGPTDNPHVAVFQAGDIDASPKADGPDLALVLPGEEIEILLSTRE